MIPLAVTATVQGAVSMPYGPVALDSMLAYAVVLRDRIPMATHPDEVRQIDIPVAKEPGGRFHLATVAVYAVERHEHRWINRRFPIPEAQDLGDAKLRTLRINAGAQKSYRLPLDTVHVAGDMLRWWCVGDRRAIEELLGLIWYLGKKRSTGLGRVLRWDVAPCEAWDGFPVVLDGKPLRHLPPDWPGLVDPEVRTCNLTYPYQATLNPHEQPCAVPEMVQ